VPVLEFRASVVIGSGSLSFEMIRSLVERLPIMITPKWVRVMAQPIAINDLLEYLLAALRLPLSQYAVYEIGGADQVSYADIMYEYARQRGLRRYMLSVPVLTPYLSSLWLGLVTPLYARVGRKLIESIIHPTVVRDVAALGTFAVRPVGIEEAIRRALAREEREFVDTRWSDALSSCGEPRSWGGARFGAAYRGFADRKRRGASRGCLRADSGHWWSYRVVPMELAVAIARVSRLVSRWRRHAARAPASHTAPCR
jgi:hypothetical protein